MPNKHLNVWLHGIRVARLSEPSRYRLRMDFTTDALDTFGEGSRVLSLSLPISPEPAVDGKGRPGSIVSALIEGLLPEGQSAPTSRPRGRLLGNVAPTRPATAEATMERVYESVDQVALPPGTEHLKTRLKSLWARRSWPVGGAKTVDLDHLSG